MGDSPFHHACSHRNMDVIKLLMSSPKVDTVIQNHKGNTVLHDACKVCHLDVLQWLTDGSGSAEVDDPKSRSNISRNTENGINSDDGNSDNNNSSNDDNKRDMPPAIAPDASPQPKPMNEPRTPSPARPAGMHTIANVQNNEGNTALHCACIEGHLEIVTYMLSTFALDVSIQNMNGMAPLHHASKAGHAEIARLLLNLQSNRDDVNLQNRDGQTSLHLACQQDHFDIVATLMNQEAIDCNVRDDDGNVPIWYACRKSALDIVNLLVSSGKVDVNVCNKRNETLLRMVLRLRDEAPLQEAILRGAGRSSVTVQWYTELEK
uniref:Uncharacterized protein n=1 Tax=Craspedostauros australis TaxID=1486917 RepID=A0A7R9WR58_9STRA